MRRFVIAAMVAAGIVPVSDASVCAAAAGERRAALVVQFSTGEVQDFCVAFTREEERRGFTGIDLLERSGLPVVFGGTSAAASVCRIGADGCADGKSCFCGCPVASSPSCSFWGYYTINTSGGWSFSQVGATSRLIHDGDVDGWRYGNHNGGRGAPGRQTFAALCSKARRVAAAAPAPRAKVSRSLTGVGVAAGVLASFGIGIALAMRKKRGLE